MEKRLLWKTATGRLAPILTLDKKKRGKTTLTTVKDFQRGGKIELFWEDQQGQVSAGLFHIKNLPPNHPGEPVCNISYDYNGRNQVKITIKTHQEVLAFQKLNVPVRFKRPNNRFTFFLLLGVTAVIIIAALLFWQFSLWPDKQAPPHQPVKPADNTAITAPRSTVPEKTIPEETTEMPAPPGEKQEAAAPLALTVYFAPESAVLLPEAVAALERIAEETDFNSFSTVTFSGHCALFGTEKSRQTLSLERAGVTARFLQELKPLPEETRIIGRGGGSPISAEKEKQDLNRRVEIEFTP